MAYTGVNKSTDFQNNITYQGTNGAQTKNVGMQPDWQWTKTVQPDTGSSAEHMLVDSVRGVTKTIVTNSANLESTISNGLTAFSSTGYTFGNNDRYTSASNSFVSWNWKAGTAVSGNTSGSGTYKTYTGSVNTTSGFSIIRYQGNGTAGHTIPHHLGKKPDMIIVKALSTNDDWMVFHQAMGPTKFMILNSNTNEASGTQWNNTEPTSSVFSIGANNNMNQNNNYFVAYCFTNTPGFSFAGQYTGNANADGPFCYTGFAPKWVMLKRMDSSGYSWQIMDAARNNTNQVTSLLKAEVFNPQQDPSDVKSFYSNGFKIDNAAAENNADFYSAGGRFLYIAFGQTLVGTNNVPNKAT
tara:strand:+ start:264 stop:1325 length:1062 start_codon:yes stop_codon:yes gene_type:complete